MSETIILRGIEVKLSSPEGHEFVVSAAQAAEGLIDDSELAETFELSPEDLKNLADNKAVGRAIKAELTRRVNSGVAARQAAAKIFVRAPKAMGEILDSSQTPPRVKIEASRELRATAIGTGDDNRPAETERFHIVINLGSDTLTFDKSRAPDPNDSPPDEQPKLTTAKQPKLVVLSNNGISDNE